MFSVFRGRFFTVAVGKRFVNLFEAALVGVKGGQFELPFACTAGLEPDRLIEIDLQNGSICTQAGLQPAPRPRDASSFDGAASLMDFHSPEDRERAKVEKVECRSVITQFFACLTLMNCLGRS